MIVTGSSSRLITASIALCCWALRIPTTLAQTEGDVTVVTVVVPSTTTTTTTMTASMTNANHKNIIHTSEDSKHHYDNPPCAFPDEEAIRIMGIDGQFCAPKCDAATDACSKDVPEGVTGSPLCALQSPTGDKFCAILCLPEEEEEEELDSNNNNNHKDLTPAWLRGTLTTEDERRVGGGDCGPMMCQPVPNQHGVGICTYTSSTSSLS